MDDAKVARWWHLWINHMVIVTFSTTPASSTSPCSATLWLCHQIQWHLWIYWYLLAMMVVSRSAWIVIDISRQHTNKKKFAKIKKKNEKSLHFFLLALPTAFCTSVRPFFAAFFLSNYFFAQFSSRTFPSFFLRVWMAERKGFGEGEERLAGSFRVSPFCPPNKTQQNPSQLTIQNTKVFSFVSFDITNFSSQISQLFLSCLSLYFPF